MINAHPKFFKKLKEPFVTLFILATFYLLNVFNSWPGLKLSGWRGDIKYADQEYVLHYAKCFAEFGANIYSSGSNLGKCGGYVYSVDLLRAINWFGLENLNRNSLGISFLLLVLLIIFFIVSLNQNNKRIETVQLLAFTSPGVWLLLERGNYDELILIFLFLGSLTIKTKMAPVGFIFIAFATLYKFYTLPVLVIFAMLHLKRNNSFFYIPILVSVALRTLFTISDISKFPETWNISFGLKSLGLYFNLLFNKLNLNFQFSDIATSVLGLSLLITFSILFRHFNVNFVLQNNFNKKPPELSHRIFGIFLCTFLSCYFGGMSFDYRLTFFAVVVVLSRSIFLPNKAQKTSTIIGVFALWTSCFNFGLPRSIFLLFQLLGDIGIAMIVSLYLNAFLSQANSQKSGKLMNLKNWKMQRFTS